MDFIHNLWCENKSEKCKIQILSFVDDFSMKNMVKKEMKKGMKI